MPRIGKYIATAAAVIAAAVVLFLVLSHYYVHDPSQGAPVCLFKALTGWDCPGCGSQRALHAMLHGNFGAAWRFNPFIFFAVPLAVFYIVAEARRRSNPRLYAVAVSPLCLSLIILATVLFTVLRNIL